MRKKYQEGFTLIEVIICVCIIFILSGLVITRIINAVEDAKTSTCIANRKIIERVYPIYQIKESSPYTFAQFFADLETINADRKYLAFIPVCPSLGEYSATARSEQILCSIEEHNAHLRIQDNTAEELIGRVIGILDSFKNPDGTWNAQALSDAGITQYQVTNNSAFRNLYLQDYSWDVVTNTAGQAQTIMFYLLPSGETLVYAVSNTGQPWNANYVFDSTTGKWHYSSSGINLANLYKDTSSSTTYIDAVMSQVRASGEVLLMDNVFHN